MTPQSIGIIGCGGIAELVLATLVREIPAPLKQVSLLATSQSVDAARALLNRLGDKLASTRRVHADPAAFIADGPDVVAECASHAAVREYGDAILKSGSDLIVISIGALSDETLRARLTQAARAGGARLVLPAGAIAGIDALAAARLSGLEIRRLYRTQAAESLARNACREIACTRWDR